MALVGTTRNGDLQRLDRTGKATMFGFSDQQVHMLGHHNVSQYDEVIAPASSFERVFEPASRRS